MAGAGVLPGGGDVLPAGVGILKAGVGVLPAGAGVLPVGAGVFPAGAGVLPAGGVSAASILQPGTPGGHARQLLSAAGSLASESKSQGEIDRCDYSYYQLFRCSFWVCFYIAVHRLKH